MLRDRHAAEPGLHPRGFIFHMSRCGSTLVSQMLASLARNVVISEAGSIGSVLRARFRDPSLTEEARAEWLRWTVSALGQQRSSSEENLFIKFDCWSVLDLSLILRAFPGVPWVFLCRDPIEVLVSQLGHRGAHMVPGAIEPELFDMTLDQVFEMHPEEYCGRVLARICEAALQGDERGARMMINYDQLPSAVWSRVADFFGLQASDADLDAFKRASGVDAKNPSLEFESDSYAKRAQASDKVREVAAKWLTPLYERLEDARFGEAAS